MSDHLYRLALLAWPAEYRSDHGDELIDTAREMHGGQFSLREFGALAANGVGARHLAATGGSRLVSWDGAVRFGLLLMMAQVLGEVLTAWSAGGPDYLSETWTETLVSALVLSAVAIAFLLFVPGRLMAAIFTGLVVVAWFWGPTAMPRIELAAYSVAVIVPALWLARCNRVAGGRVVVSLIAWVAAMVAFAAAVGDFWVAHDGLVMVLSVMAIAIARFDPRLAAGAGTFWLMRILVTASSWLDRDGWGIFGSMPAVQITAFVALAIGCLVSAVARHEQLRPARLT